MQPRATRTEHQSIGTRRSLEVARPSPPQIPLFLFQCQEKGGALLKWDAVRSHETQRLPLAFPPASVTSPY